MKASLIDQQEDGVNQQNKVFPLDG